MFGGCCILPGEICICPYNTHYTPHTPVSRDRRGTSSGRSSSCLGWVGKWSNSCSSFAVINKTTHPDILFPLDLTCLHTYVCSGVDDFQLVNADGGDTSSIVLGGRIKPHLILLESTLGRRFARCRPQVKCNVLPFFMANIDTRPWRKQYIIEWIRYAFINK